jgi:hypothetical protein
MMRLARHAAAIALALLVGAGALRAQDSVPDTPRPAPPLPKGQKEIRYTDQSQIPPQLMQAIKASWCSLEGWMPEVPVHVFEVKKAGSRRIVAIVPCGRIILRSRAFIFVSRPIGQPPRPMAFPVIDALGGIGTSFAPGYLTWDADNQVLHARLGSDLCPTPALRYTYRFESQDEQDAPLSWVLLKAEIDQISSGCDGQPDKWEAFWEAPTLSDQQRPK